jgi:hypothetical protein
MPMPGLLRSMSRLARPLRGYGYVGILALLAACQSRHDPADTSTIPPVGRYEGSISPNGQAEMRAALDIRHPSPGHYEAELTVPTAGTLSFVADSIYFTNNQLRLSRPAHPGQVLTLTLDGDFWRGSLALDSTKAPTILVKRGAPTPSVYRVEEVPQANGSAWLFAPSDTGTPGPALALLPNAATAPAAALWADALAREGVIVLVLPTADSATAATEAPRLQAAFRLLRATPGADTTNIGVWGAGLRAGALAQIVGRPGSPRVAFLIAQNPEFDLAGKAAFRELTDRKLPLLGLYSGAATQWASALRNATDGRRTAVIRTYKAAGTDLLVPNGLAPRFGPGLPGEVVDWLRSQ